MSEKNPYIELDNKLNDPLKSYINYNGKCYELSDAVTRFFQMEEKIDNLEIVVKNLDQSIYDLDLEVSKILERIDDLQQEKADKE